MHKQQQDVTEFHKAMGQLEPKIPTKCSGKTALLRLKLIFEEFTELCEALGFADISGRDFDPERQDLVECADAIADLLYVTYGTANALGIDIEPVWDEVQRSNLTKFIDGYRRKDGKWMKGPSYSPANIAPIIQKQMEG